MSFWRRIFGRRDEEQGSSSAPAPPALPPHEAQARAAELWIDEAQGREALADPIFVGTIEPTLTISLAGAIAAILLAIYLPMFDMVNTIK